MRSNAGMANRQGDVDLCFVQVSAPQLELWLGLASLTWPSVTITNSAFRMILLFTYTTLARWFYNRQTLSSLWGRNCSFTFMSICTRLS